MAESNDYNIVAFFKCKAPITKTNEGIFYDSYEHIGDRESFHRCYMKKFDKNELEDCFKKLENNSNGVTCNYIGRQYLS
jgi:hypothetical protein